MKFVIVDERGDFISDIKNRLAICDDIDVEVVEYLTSPGPLADVLNNKPVNAVVIADNSLEVLTFIPGVPTYVYQTQNDTNELIAQRGFPCIGAPNSAKEIINLLLNVQSMPMPAPAPAAPPPAPQPEQQGMYQQPMAPQQGMYEQPMQGQQMPMYGQPMNPQQGMYGQPNQQGMYGQPMPNGSQSMPQQGMYEQPMQGQQMPMYGQGMYGQPNQQGMYGQSMPQQGMYGQPMQGQQMSMYGQGMYGQPAQGQQMPEQPANEPLVPEPEADGKGKKNKKTRKLGKEKKAAPEPEIKKEPEPQPQPQPVMPVFQNPADAEPMIQLNSADNGEIETKVVTVYSAKGGVGKTTLSSEIAAYLALTCRKRGKLRVCIVDYNVDFGDVMTTLGFDPEGVNMCVWASEINERLEAGESTEYTTEDMEANLLQKKEFAAGVELYGLLAPPNHEDSMSLTEDALDIMLKNLAENGHYDFVICDTGNNTRDSSIIALDYADFIFMVVTQDITTINCNDSFITTMRKMDFDESRIRVIINNIASAKETSISVHDIESFIKFPCIAHIKRNTDVIKANNTSVPLVFKPNHEFTKELRRIITFLVNDGEVEDTGAAKKGLNIGSMFKKK